MVRRDRSTANVIDWLNTDGAACYREAAADCIRNCEGDPARTAQRYLEGVLLLHHDARTGFITGAAAKAVEEAKQDVDLGSVDWGAVAEHLVKEKRDE